MNCLTIGMFLSSNIRTACPKVAFILALLMVFFCSPSNSVNLEYQGTALKILSQQKVSIGVIRWTAMPIINTVDQSSPRGILATMEKQIFSW